MFKLETQSKENFAIARKCGQSITEITTIKKTRKNPFQNEVDSLKTLKVCPKWNPIIAEKRLRSIIC